MRNPRSEIRNPNGNGNERLLRFLSATAEQQAAIDRILEGRMEPAAEPPRGPLLIRASDAAVLLGVHRTTIWRLVKAGRLGTVELLGAVRIRRADVEGLAAGDQAAGRGAPAGAGSPKSEVRGPKANGV
jgi:excisionase family DNA binding protein